jgi:hypothetical protein
MTARRFVFGDRLPKSQTTHIFSRRMTLVANFVAPPGRASLVVMLNSVISIFVNNLGGRGYYGYFCVF